jgi:iron-sulfur cluster assembly accessory protein
MSAVTEAVPVTVTDRAFVRIAEIIADEPGAIGLRVSVSGGGCSGFQYDFGVERSSNADDIVVKRDDGVAVVIDEMSLQFLKGSAIDFVDDLIGAKFEIRNPNATASCGCGTSFSI